MSDDYDEDIPWGDGSPDRIIAITKMKTCQACGKWFRPADMPWPYTGTRNVKQYDDECDCSNPIRCSLNKGFHWEGNRAVKD